jgi:hypothetical protein
MRLSTAQILVILVGACAVSHDNQQERIQVPLFYEPIYAIPFGEQRRLTDVKTMLPKEKVIPNSYDARGSNIEFSMPTYDSVQELQVMRPSVRLLRISYKSFLHRKTTGLIPRMRAYDRRIF